MYIEGFVLQHFSALSKADINSTTPSCQRHVVLYYFLSDNSKQDTSTTTAYKNHLISLLKEKKY